MVATDAIFAGSIPAIYEQHLVRGDLARRRRARSRGGHGSREARRVLRPSGRYLFNVWDRLAQNEVSEIVTRAVAALFPSDPPLFFERTPLGYFDIAAIRRELGDAGFDNVEIETVQKVSRAPSAELVAMGLCHGTPLRGEIEARDPTRLAEATAAAAAALSARFGNAGFDNRMHAHIVTADR